MFHHALVINCASKFKPMAVLNGLKHTWASIGEPAPITPTTAPWALTTTTPADRDWETS